MWIVIGNEKFRSVGLVFRIALDKGFKGGLELITQRLKAGDNTWEKLIRPGRQSFQILIDGKEYTSLRQVYHVCRKRGYSGGYSTLRARFRDGVRTIEGFINPVQKWSSNTRQIEGITYPNLRTALAEAIKHGYTGTRDMFKHRTKTPTTWSKVLRPAQPGKKL